MTYPAAKGVDCCVCNLGIWLRDEAEFRCGPCGGTHYVCLGCFLRWDMGTKQQRLEQHRPLEVCPDSDEFRTVMPLLDS